MGRLVDTKELVLGDFARVAEARELRFVVIGAGARVLFCESTKLDPGRLTTDWDLAVPVQDWREYHELISALTDPASGHFAPTETEHRLLHRQTSVLLDLVPFGGVEEPVGTLTWPSGQKMDVQGIDLVLSKSAVYELGAIEIPYASRLMQAQQKAAAYLDRRDRGVTHDVLDFMWVLRNYEEAGNESRVFDEAWATIEGNDIEPFAWGAALLGRDLKRNAAELLEPVRRLLAELDDSESRASRDLRPKQAHDHGQRVLSEIRELGRAVRAGLDADSTA